MDLADSNQCKTSIYWYHCSRRCC